jgi:hypothetical protein
MADEENAAPAIKTGIEQMLLPLQKLVDKLLGPAATEVGLSLSDSLKVWRFKRQIRLLQEVKRLLDQSGQDIKPIATRLFFPVLEAASIEDDDEMQTRWAALLANEAISVGSVHPSFIDILKQLAPGDARLLDRISDSCTSTNTHTIQWWMISPRSQPEQRERDQGAIGNLVRLGLVVTDYDLVDTNRQLKIVGGHAQLLSTPKLKENDTLSDVAVRFVQVCRAPKQSAR